MPAADSNVAGNRALGPWGSEALGKVGEQSSGVLTDNMQAQARVVVSIVRADTFEPILIYV
jgi:hypothetical protein